MAAVGFEPTPPKRLVPKTSALDHSATQPDMEAQAILTSFHFIRSGLVVAAKLHQEKGTPQDIERKTLYDKQDIKGLLFIYHKIKLKFPIILSTRVRYIRKSSLGMFFS